MKNIISILAALSLFFFSATVFAGEGPLALPSGANPEAKKHNVEGIDHWQQGHYDVALKHFSAASKLMVLRERFILTRPFLMTRWENMESPPSILE